MYNGTNLLAIPEHLPNRYVNACMKILFTQEELANGFIIYGNKKSKTKRTQLDRDRIELLKSKFKFFKKFKISFLIVIFL